MRSSQPRRVAVIHSTVPGEAGASGGQFRVDLKGALEQRVRLGKVTLVRMNFGQKREAFGGVRCNFKRSTTAGLGRRRAALQPEHHGESGVRMNIIGSQQVQEHIAKVVVCLCQLGIDLKSAAVAGQRFLETPEIAQGVSQVAVRISKIRFDVERAAVAHHRIV